MACKCLQFIIFYESINITKNALVFPSIWRYLVKILNRICMWSCGEGCRSQLSDSRRLASWTGVSKSIIAFCVFSPLKELVFVSTESLIGLWCLLLIGSLTTLERKALFACSLGTVLNPQQCWIDCELCSLLYFYPWFDGDLDLNILAFNSNKFKLHSPEIFPLNLQSQLPNLSPSSIQSDKWQWVNDNVHLRLFSSRLVDNMERTLGMELKGWFF